VDGGSTDRTLSILEKMSRDLNAEDFRLKVLEERNFSNLRSPSNARNIGIMKSSGEYIIFLDADMVLLGRDFVRKVKAGLDANPWVAIKLKLMMDTLLEKMIAGRSLGKNEYWIWVYSAVRRSMFENRMFDPYLGAGEDAVFYRLS